MYKKEKHIFFCFNFKFCDVFWFIFALPVFQISLNMLKSFYIWDQIYPFNTTQSPSNLWQFRFVCFVLLGFNTTFNNFPVILQLSVLLVEEAEVPGENHRPWADNWQTLSCAMGVKRNLFFIVQTQARTHAV